MDMVAQVIQKVNDVFDKNYLETIARDTGFLKRKRKVDPKKFLENMLLLKLESPGNSLEDLAYEFNQHGCVISKQALHKKFNKPALEFIQTVLSKLLEHTFSHSATCLGSIPFIKNVQVIDSSEIRLHSALKNIFPQVRNQGAAIKLQSLIDVVKHQVLSLEVRPSKEPDQGYKKHIRHVQTADLLIGDLGYFCVDTFSEIEAKKGFFLSRYFKKTNVYDMAHKELINLRGVLHQAREGKIELQIMLGASQFPCRLVGLKLTEDAYQKRLKTLEKKRRKDPRTKKNDDDLLNQWTLFVTNLPVSIEADILLKLYSLRWQIELFFKMMKTFLKLRAIDDVNEQRALISLHVLLIAIVLLSFVAMTIVDQEISLYKASKLFVKHVRDFMGYISNKKKCAISWLRELIGTFALKESRVNRPSTKLSLNRSPVYA